MDNATEPAKTNRHGLTEQEQREIGSAEVARWTITPPGGEPMSLDDHAAYQAKREAERQESLARMRVSMAQRRRECGLAEVPIGVTLGGSFSTEP